MLPTLPDLDLRGERAIPASVWGRQDLLRLVVAEMDLTELPAAVGRLTALTTLDAAHNRLRAVPDELARLEALEILYLGDNVQNGPPVRDGSADVEVDHALQLLGHADAFRSGSAPIPDERRVAGPRPGGVTVSRR